MANTFKPDVAFIGLGAMGYGMATNLVRNGYAVTGFDVWGPTLDRFKVAGGKTALTPAEVVQGKDHCVCMVATAQQAQEVLLECANPAVPALPNEAVLLLCSTVPCAYVQSLEQQLKDMGRGDIFLIDAPVSGGSARAADGTLSIMAGASEEAIFRGRELLQAMSDPEKLYIGKGGIGAGSNLKMCHQVLAASQILSNSEALGFASHLGLDLEAACKRIIDSEAWSWMFEHRSPRSLHPEFLPLVSAVTTIIKDSGIITSEARRRGFPTPMTSIAEQQYLLGLGRGYGANDDSSLIRLYNEGKGKVGPVEGAATTDAEKLGHVIGLLKGIHLCAAAEALTFAQKCGLDLDQVFDLCMNAAGGSAMLQTAGPDMIGLLRGETVAAAEGLLGLVKEVQAAVDEAQRLKAPIPLGVQAFNLLQLASQRYSQGRADVGVAFVAKLWAP